MVARRNKPKKPVVHIVVLGSASAATTAAQFAQFGGAVAYTVDKIENSGRRVELDVLFVMENQYAPLGWRKLLGWKIKAAGDPLDLSAVAFSLAHPAALRRIGFAMFERTGGEMVLGYGKPAPAKPEELALLDMSEAFVIEGVGTAVANGATDMLKLVAKRINKAAGETLVEVE